MWLKLKDKMFNLDRLVRICLSKSPHNTGVYIEGDDIYHQIFSGTEEENIAYLSKLSFHMDTERKVIYHEEILEGMGVE